MYKQALYLLNCKEKKEVFLFCLDYDMLFISSRPRVTSGQEKRDPILNCFISLEKITLSRQKQKVSFYLFDKSWYFFGKYVINM